jgi:hypothetical protein
LSPDAPGLPEPVNLCDAVLFDKRLSLPQSVKGLKARLQDQLCRRIVKVVLSHERRPPSFGLG